MGVSRSFEGVSAPKAPWIWLRVAAGGVVCASSALALDAWLRLWVLTRHRRREAARIAAFNRAVHLWGRTMFSTASWAVGLPVLVQGRVPSSGRYLIVANHQSSLDVPLLITTFRALNLKFVAMEQLRHGKPTISLVLRHGGFAIVGKNSTGEDLATLARFARDLERFDGSPVIFPAGRLERDQGARPFYLAGIEVLRRGSRLPILPVVVDGMAKAPSIGGILRLAGSRVTVRVYEPIPCEEVEKDPRAAYLELEERIYGEVAKIRGEPGKLPEGFA